MNIEEIKMVAINEIFNPTFELTKQFLGTNIIAYENGIPMVEDIIISDDTVEVYFPVQNENYYFVLYVDYKPSPKLRFMNTSPGTDVYLYVSSESNSLDELVSILRVEPTNSWRVGERKKIHESGDVL